MNIFINCGKVKNDHPCMAKDMYKGTYFAQNLALAKKKADDEHIFILSAKYGLLRLTDWIKPYNVTLNGKTKEQKIKWGGYVFRQSLKKHIDLNNGIYYLSKNYMEGLYPYIDIKTIKEPFKNMGLFQRKHIIAQLCKKTV